MVLLLLAPWCVYADDEAPPAPATRIHDVVSLFSRDHEAFDQISVRLRDFESRHGIPVFLAVYSPLMFDDAGSQGRFLFDRWIGDGADGVVILFNIESGKAVVTLPMAGVGAAGPESRLPEFHLSAIVRELDTMEAGRGDKIAFLDSYTTTLVNRLDVLLKKEGESASAPWQFAILVLALGCVVAGVGFFVRKVIREATRGSRQQHRFPEVEIATRLGASHGGARVNVLSYRSQPPERDERS